MDGGDLVASSLDANAMAHSRRRGLTATGTTVMILCLVAGWGVVYFIGLVGALWRFR